METSAPFDSLDRPPVDMLSYDGALTRFAATEATFGGGLSNHGPMVVEALVSMGAEQFIGSFVEAYAPRLDPSSPVEVEVPADWRSWLAGELPELVPAVAAAAGHGLLRTAHAVRGIERAESAMGSVPRARLLELALAVEYWRSHHWVLPAPERLAGDAEPGEWAAHLGRLPEDQRREGLLTGNLRAAGATPGFSERVATLGSAGRPQDTFDLLAAESARLLMANDGIDAFALLHGTTVSTMARVLVDHLDEPEVGRLEASVASFVAAAVIGFDESNDRESSTDAAELAVDVDELPRRAAVTLDDHTIKFTDACLGVFGRTGEPVLLAAAHHRIGAPAEE